MALASLMLADDEFCVLRASVADKLISCGDGDGALLYLYLLRQGKDFNETTALKNLGFSKARYDNAVFTLTKLELAINPLESKKQPENPMPEYSVSELKTVRTNDHRFAAVCQTAESVLNQTLTTKQLRLLYTAYDYLCLPADIIIELLTYLKSKKEKISTRDLQGEIYLWADMGIFSSEKALEYLSKRSAEKPIIDKIMSMLGIIDHEANAEEERYLSRFISLGFEAEAVVLAKERMEGSLGKFSWKYLNSILTRWHTNGVHTIAEITALEPNYKPKQPTMTQQAYKNNNQPVDDWEDEWLSRIKNKEGDVTVGI